MSGSEPITDPVEPLADLMAAKVYLGMGYAGAFAALPSATRERYLAVAREYLRSIAVPTARAALLAWVNALPDDGHA